MYKSKYEIPLIVNNPHGYREKSNIISSWQVAKTVLSLFQTLVINTAHLIWALLVGIFSFIRSTWRSNPWIKSLPWLRLIILGLSAYYVLSDHSIFSFSTAVPSIEQTPAPNNGGKAVFAALSISDQPSSKKEEARTKDLTPISPALLKNPSVQGFINRFKEVAREEMKLYGIPASIKMGQAIIESQAGKSVLAKNSNNYFGIKCKAKCLGCTCKNYADDNKYDMFRVFDSAWESWRAHSKLLCNPRYSKLPLYGKDYKKWAKGLKKAGYATDPAYAEKLISVIEKYNLTMLDQ